METVKRVSDLHDLQGKYVLVRSSLNVPIENDQVTNQFRIARALPTLQHLTKAGARVIVTAHIGREPEESLRPVYDVLSESLDVVWGESLLGESVQAKRGALEDGQVLMLENVRSDWREKANDVTLAEDLAALADMYVDDAFAAAHREHASVVGVPQFLPSYAGINFLLEYEELKRSFKPEDPAIFVLGGAKFETKMPLVEKFLEKYNHVFVGGALAHDIWAARGIEVGRSLRSDVDLSGSPMVNNEKLLLPVDVVVKNEAGNVRTTHVDDVQPDEAIVDAGPETANMLSLYTRGAKTILWNGPLGTYEGGFAEGTEALAKVVAESEAYSIVGGGDTIASIESLGLSGKFGFLSTGGGAMLSFLEHETLPATEALKNCPH